MGVTDAVRRLDPGRAYLVCGACPSLVLPFGEFDVAEKPSRESAYAREHGYRVGRESGVAVCVHPDRVGLPAQRYASQGVPVPGVEGPAEPPPLPGEVGGLDTWLVDYLSDVEPEVFGQALEQAAETARDRFPGEAVTESFRRALSSGLLS